ncbi:hypothetical protein SARC_03017 [Sphaeroforma arctica JP610]|uniref:RAP domain-containing protein n=1 Tax=Sphaeroforma arctica JP610 TaxID=667725 RepID=A0A0L0G6Y2_9EUKA|nr:hypothetical protein SARC_03017 [Sphaeroforma arctica JP610]KNC84775.1 hypothetical protein SARC_03017 [Sphaeroforma arctica JP610]|eukprot:XP_014158677.1 hypothetical protein SARC_03017 [Sphaeroforma arctica JP610]
MYVAGLTPVVEKMLQTIAGKQPAKVARLDMATTLRAYFAMVRLDPECGDVLGGPAVQAFSPFIPKSAQDVTNPKGQSVTPMHPDEVALWAWTTCSTPAVSDPMVKEALLYLLSYIGGNGRLEDSSQNVFETTTFMPHQLMSMTFQVYLSVANLAQERLPLSRPQKAALAKIKHSFANGGRDEEQPETPNRSEQKLAQTVGALNLGSVQPQFKAKNGYTIDVAVPEKKLAFEFQGPTHFSSAPAMINQRIPMAGLQLKQRHLKAEGWRVVHIPFWEWAELRIVDRSKYLTEKIKESKNKLPVGEPNTSAHYANETEVPDFEGLETPRRGTLWKSVGNFREDRHKGPRGKRPSFDVVASYLKDRRNKLSDRSAKLLAEDYGREYDLSEEERERIRRYLRKSPEPATN